MRFNGLSPSEISDKIFVSHEVISSIPPRSVRIASGSRQGYLAGVDLTPREVHLHLNYAGRSSADANQLASKVAALLCTDSLAEYEPTHTPGRALSVILEGASDMTWRWGFGVVEYKFLAPRPFFHSTSETVVQGFGSVYVEPRGSVPIRPVITHRMASAAGALLISAGSDAIMSVRDPDVEQLPAGTVVSVDFSKRLCTINGSDANDYVDYTVSEWHPDIRGGTMITLSDPGATTVRWYDEWM